jgi:hypothetical protein
MPPGSWERDERTVAWIYGSILVAAAVVVATEVIASKPGQILLYTTSTMVVVWLVHSYAAFVGHGGRIDIGGVGARVRHAMSTEFAVLASATETILRLWCVVAAVCVLATLVGYAAGDSASGGLRAAINGFAAGALLVMLIDSMIPEAARNAGRVAGLVTTLGFAVGIALSNTR